MHITTCIAWPTIINYNVGIVRQNNNATSHKTILRIMQSENLGFVNSLKTYYFHDIWYWKVKKTKQQHIFGKLLCIDWLMSSWTIWNKIGSGVLNVS